MIYDHTNYTGLSSRILSKQVPVDVHQNTRGSQTALHWEKANAQPFGFILWRDVSIFVSLSYPL